MKPLVLVVFLFLVLFLIASTGLAQVDLTPDTPAVASQQEIVVTEPQVITIQQSAPQEAPITNQIPVTGACSDPYIVQSGDSLSRIAEICGMSVGAIRMANPEIANINIIYPGQQLRIPGGPQAQVIPQVPVTGDEITAAPEAAPSTTGLLVDPTPTTQIVPVPVTGSIPFIRASIPLQVKAIDFPANTSVAISIGPVDGQKTVVSNEITDFAGYMVTTIALPGAPGAQVPWVVVVSTSSQPVVSAQSQAFYIISNQ